MATLRWSCIVALVSLLAVNGLAQTSMPTTKAMPAAADVLGQVPSGVLAVLVVKDVRQTTDKVDKFLTESGISRLIGRQMPKGALETITGAAMLGQGFNPNGGFAVALMDPKPYDVDLAEMLMPTPTSGPSASPTTAVAEKKLPFVIYVPGNDVESVFSNYKISQAGKYSQVALRMGVMYAAKSGGYVVISPIEKVLDDALAAPRKLSADIGGQEADVMKDSAFAIYLNMKLGSPVVMKLMDKAQTEMARKAGPGKMPFGPLPFMDAYKEMVQAVQTVVLAGKIEPTGLLFDLHIGLDPNSLIGKQLPLYHGTSGTYVDRLPNLPYFVAVGAQVRNSKEASENLTKSMDQMLATDTFKALSPETKTRINKLLVDMQAQVTGLQFVLGGAPEGVSGFAGAGVFECKDSGAFKTLIAEAADVVQEVVHSLAGEDMNLKNVAISYKKDAEKSGDMSVDVIEVTSPGLDKNAEDLTKALGEEKLRFRVAALDQGLAVVTIGGGEAMVAAALKNARGGGSIPSEPGTLEALKYMPSSRICVEMFNIGNLFAIIQKSSEGAGMLPVNFQSKTPITLGVGVSGSGERVSLYIPNDIIKDVTGLAAMFFGGAPGGAEQSPATTKPSDF